jgi:hypothetical protein
LENISERLLVVSLLAVETILKHPCCVMGVARLAAFPRSVVVQPEECRQKQPVERRDVVEEVFAEGWDVEAILFDGITV